MYELRQKHSTAYRIIFGIIVWLLFLTILKIAFRSRPFKFNDVLIQVANEINKHAPIILDSITRFDYAYALHENIFQYNYTIMTLDRMEVDTLLFKPIEKESIMQQIKENPQTSIFKDNNIEIRARYRDKNGAYLMTVSIHPNEY